MAVFHYNCTNCGNSHPVETLCPRPRQSEVERYKKELIGKFDDFSKGYSKTTKIVLMALRTKLFGETYDK